MATKKADMWSGDEQAATVAAIGEFDAAVVVSIFNEDAPLAGLLHATFDGFAGTGHVALDAWLTVVREDVLKALDEMGDFVYAVTVIDDTATLSVDGERSFVIGGDASFKKAVQKAYVVQPEALLLPEGKKPKPKLSAVGEGRASSTAKKTPAKSTAKKAPVARKAAAKKAAAKKAPAKKAPAKAASKKAPAKAPAKKTTTAPAVKSKARKPARKTG